MSGLEVVGAISACITLVDFSKKLLDAAGDAHGFPEAFRVVQNLLPLIARTLQNARDRSTAASEDDLIAVESALRSCKRDAQSLKDVLEEVMTSEKDGRLTRYKKHVRSAGKGHKVEALARQIFEQLQLLQANHVFANVATKRDLQAAATKLKETTPSLDEEDGCYISNGSGPINVARDHAKQTNNNFSGKFKPLGDMNFGTVTYNHYQQNDEEACKRSKSQEILDSLLFKEIEWREEQIHESYGETFNWIFEDKNTPFKQWLGSGSDAFWICGKAGSGKSTLMKSLANHPTTDEILRQWAGTHKLIIVKHFFWNSGTKMQQTQLGLMQSLLHQILRNCPNLIPYASPSRWNAASFDARGNAWTRKELTSAFDNIMLDRALDTHFCFFIDGLDEYTDDTGGDHYQLVQDLHSLDQSAHVKLCVSSRPWTVFEDRYGKDKKLKIIVQHHTRSDLYHYVNGMLAEDPRFLRLANVEPKAHAIVHDIVCRADGVFLWVFLVVKSLLRGLTDRDDTSELQRRLDEMPEDLDAYFRKTFDNIENVYRAQAMCAFQFLAETGHFPLIFIHFISEEVLDSKYGLGAKIGTMTRTEVDKAHDKARFRLNKWCRDLVVIMNMENIVKGEGPREQVWVSHRTVHDFLRTQEMQKEFLKYRVCQASHLEGLCMAYLALTKIWLLKDIDHINELLHWAKTCEDRESMTPLEVLDDLETTAGTVMKQKNDPAGRRGMLWHAVRHGLTLYVGECLDRDPGCETKIWEAMLPDNIGSDIWYPLDAPTIWRMTNMLLRKGADPNAILVNPMSTLIDNLHNKTAWQKLLQYQGIKVRSKLAKLLLLNGADPDVEIMLWDGSLYSVRRLLLEGNKISYRDHHNALDTQEITEQEIDSWLAEARARKAAKTLKALEDVKDQNGSIAASLGPWYPTSIIIFVCAAVLAIYRDSIICFALPFLHDFGFQWRPDEA